MYDPFLRKEAFEDKLWYDDFWIFHNISICQPQDEHVTEIREALARFLFATRTAPGQERGKTYIIGNGAVGINDMDAYIQAIRGEDAGNRPQSEQTPRTDALKGTE